MLNGIFFGDIFITLDLSGFIAFLVRLLLRAGYFKSPVFQKYQPNNVSEDPASDL
jgi:hypothetical protein